MAEPDFWQLRGQPIEYRLHGAHIRDRPLYLLLHEGLGCVELWRDFPQQLSDALDAPVLAYSRIGYGRSGPAALPRPVSYMHDEAHDWLPSVIDQIDADTIRLVGHSDGASIALIYLAGEAHRRQRRVDAACCLAPHVFVEPMTIASIELAAEKFASTDLPEKLRRYHGEHGDDAFRGWCDAWLNPHFARWDITDLLPAIDTPLHLIQGCDDEYGSAAQLDAIARLSAAPCRVTLLDDCRHAPQFDQPQRTIALIRAAGDS